MSRAGGYVFLEMLVSLALLSGLVVTVAGVAREVLPSYGLVPRESIAASTKLSLREDDPPASDPTGTRVSERTFENGDRWVVYSRSVNDSEDTVAVPVFVPAVHNQRASFTTMNSKEHEGTGGEPVVNVLEKGR